MADYITKKELEDVLDKKFIQYQDAIIGAIDFKFQKTDAKINILSDQVVVLDQHMDSFDKKLDKLTATLDNFLKRLTDWEDEFTLLLS